MFMAIFPDFLNGDHGFLYSCLDHPRRVFGGLFHCAKFGWNRCSNFDNIQVLQIIGFKIFIHAPKIKVFKGLFICAPLVSIKPTNTRVHYYVSVYDTRTSSDEHTACVYYYYYYYYYY